MRIVRHGLAASGGSPLMEGAQWGRRLISTLVLAACVAALTLILTEHSGRLRPSEASPFPEGPEAMEDLYAMPIDTEAR